MRDWRELREWSRRGSGERHNLGQYWLGRYFRDHVPPPDEAAAHAAALDYMLQHLPVAFHPDDELAGQITFLRDELPADIAPEDYRSALDAYNEHPTRDCRAGGNHTLPDYRALLSAGLGGLRARIAAETARPRPEKERATLAAMDASLAAVSRFFRRYADAARARGRDDLAARVEAVAEGRPRTLAEAVQLMWLLFVALRAQGRGANAFGRVDQYLIGFYDGDREAALALFCHWWCKIESLHQSGTSQSSVTNIAVGGLAPDGADATNALTYVALEATRLVQSPSTNLSARLHDGSPDAYHRACVDCLMSGIGFPALFNDEVVLPGLARLGVPPEAARDYCLVGCVETMLAGRQPGWSDSFVDTTGCLDRALRRRPGSFERLFDFFGGEMASALEANVDAFGRHLAARPADRHPDPLLSALTRDCIGRGRDLNDGGAEFPRHHGLCCLGFATMVDSLAALKKLVFEDKRLTLDEVIAALDADYAGRHGRTQMLLLNHAPKYGNDDPYVDALARAVLDRWCDLVLARRMPDGGRFLPLCASNIHNIAAGKAVGATPDGRRAGAPLSTAASPDFGRDLKGPTAFFASVAAPEYSKSIGGVVVNARFDPDFFRGEEGAERFARFTKEFVRRRIYEMQFNFNNNATLEAAVREPEKYRNLVVRVSGFSAYFVNLDPDVQRDVIRRRAHGA